MPNHLANKIVLITGAAGGFGQALAWAFLEEGAYLALLDSNACALERLAATLRAQGAQVQATVADLSTVRGVQEGINTVLAPFQGQADVFVGNVGVLVAGAFEQITEEQIASAFTMNFLTHVWACREIIPRMVGRVGANIVLMGSDQGHQPDAGLFPYASAKAALHSFAKVLAREYGPDLRVNIVAPGMSRTRMVETLIEQLAEEFQTDPMTAERLELERRGIPLKRLGTPEEIAEAVVFLASNPFCSGSTLDISGGNGRGL